MKKGRSHVFQERCEIYQFIVSYKHSYPIEKMCSVLKVSRSRYYRWFSGGPSNRSIENSLFTDLIKEVFDLSSQTYGSPRIAEQLKRKGYKISKRKVAKLMLLNGWRSKLKRRFKVTTDSNHRYPVCSNHLNRNFTPKLLNEVWVSDITYIRTAAGWLYLTTIIDLYDRQVIGWSLSTRMYTDQTIIPAWKMAVSKREITESLLFHSDRGIQYASIEFRKLINKNTLIIQSMSRKANCWDNAVAESFFKTLKAELIYQHKFTTIEEAKLAVLEYIEVWYNRKRLH
ncbi:IS3 family transposase [Flavobacterium qiangtangense]|uniref:IS3 family transposase n=1 Tax=Flavobacterium qiangtangense TaxID=1442595 RepID=A0ABW1PNT7_9FLAO